MVETIKEQATSFLFKVIIKNHGVDIKLLKSMIKYICIKKYENVFSKGIDISIEINPNTFIASMLFIKSMLTQWFRADTGVRLTEGSNAGSRTY